MATATAVQEREYTHLESSIWNKEFMQALMVFQGSREAAESFRMEVLNQARKTPALHRCSVESIRFHLLRVAKLQLDPAMPNEVFFIPRNTKQPDGKTWTMELTVQFGYAGLRKLLMRSAAVLDCFTKEVCANDLFEMPATPISLPVHRLPQGFQPRGRVIGYYAVVQMSGGNWRVLAMSVAEVQAHIALYSQEDKIGLAWQTGKRPDVKDGLCTFDKMALKTCLRMLCNGRDIPLSRDVEEAFTLDKSEHTVTTAAEHQGYDRQGHRPALTMGTGATTEDLMQDLSGASDKEAIAVKVEEATRGKKRQQEALPLRNSRDWDTLREHRDNAALPIALLEQIRSALSETEPGTDDEAWTLANAIQEHLDHAQAEVATE